MKGKDFSVRNCQHIEALIINKSEIELMTLLEFALDGTML